MKYKIGDEVWFEDPDEGISNGYGIVKDIKGEHYALLMQDGEWVEAFEHELS